MSALAQLRAALVTLTPFRAARLPPVRMWAVERPSMRAVASEAVPPMIFTLTLEPVPLLPTTALAPVFPLLLNVEPMRRLPPAETLTALAAPSSGWPMNAC